MNPRPSEFTVDTNVLVHASNPDIAEFPSSIEFVEWLKTSDAKLVVDRTLGPTSQTNRSLVFAEYLDKLKNPMVAYHVVVFMASNQRIVEVDRKPERAFKKFVEQRIRKPRDRTFTWVAHKSRACLLVSHDFEDFSAAFRADALREHGLRIATAAETLA